MSEQFKDRVTIYEVAKAADVSLATVSRVINKQNNVTEKTRVLVEGIIKKLGYKPSALAQGLATNRSTTVGIVIPATNYAYLSAMLSGMVDIGKIYGYFTTLFVTRRSKEDANDVIEKLITSHVDGAVIFDDELEDEEIKNIQSYNIPLVVIGHEMTGSQLASITLDYETPLTDIIQAVCENPQKELKFLHIPNAGRMVNRLEEFTIEQAKLANREVEVLHADDSYQRLHKFMCEYFETTKKAFFIAPRDSLAAAIINAALDKGLRVPEDIEVISIIGTKYSYITRPTISSLDIDMYEVGSIAMRMLTKLLKKNLEQKVYAFNSTFAVRGSTIK